MSLHEGFVPIPHVFRHQLTSCPRICHGKNSGSSSKRKDAILPRTFRVSASISEPYRSETKTRDIVLEGSESSFSWTDQWYAICIEANAPVDEPHPFKVFGSELVLFRTAPGRWSVLDDQCSHRLAPLSEGRITSLPGDENKAVLECAYHGWSFKGCGQCARIPQIENEKDGASIPRRANVRSYPTTVMHRLIWVWLGEPENADPALIPVPPGVSRFTDDQMIVCFSRFVPYGFETLVENLSDGEHVCFTHHGVNRFMNRSMGGRKNFYAHRTGSSRIISTSSLKSENKEPTPDGGEFMAPCSLFYDYNRALSWFVFGPVTRTTSQLFVISYFNTAKLPAIARFIISVKPIWLDHFERNLVIDGDSVLLNSLQRNMGEPSTWREKYLPVGDFDGFVYEVRKWMDDYRDSMPWKSGPLVGQEVMDSNAKREQMIERLYSHTMHCKVCRGALKGFERAIMVADWAVKMAVVALISVFVSAYVGNAAILAGEKLYRVRLIGIGLVAFIALGLYMRRSLLWFKSQLIYSDEARRRMRE